VAGAEARDGRGQGVEARFVEDAGGEEVVGEPRAGEEERPRIVDARQAECGTEVLVFEEIAHQHPPEQRSGILTPQAAHVVTGLDLALGPAHEGAGDEIGAVVGHADHGDPCEGGAGAGITPELHQVSLTSCTFEKPTEKWSCQNSASFESSGWPPGVNENRMTARPVWAS
jgi:hypothetical protein